MHASTNAPQETTGLDPVKKSRGRKRGIATDVLGLLIAVIVVAADNPSVTKGWADAGFKNAVIDHGRTLGIDIEVVQRDPHTKGFTPAPKRWIVEQTFGTLLLHRRLARDYETLPGSAWMGTVAPDVGTAMAM
ncbi:hypothetical protein [Streptomyces albicerus]|uniref:hypothetical protein n=1 Tax=Streptomyces albicerus TaxID=2569859 RepID=UPI001CED41A2|nr:hypothetical protein [Streptomyces albicerus]